MCTTSMGILLKVLCQGDQPSRAHKLILNETTIHFYKDICIEEHNVNFLYEPALRWYPLIDNTTNEMIRYSKKTEDTPLVWGSEDRVTDHWEVVMR